MQNIQNIQIDKNIPKGQINTFGEIGPPYKIGEPIKKLDNGDWLVEITLIQTGEITEYSLSHILNDPKAK
ncbi:MAG: hypothetical protein RLZZ210_1328 [Pseudomonadota bacterium]|jgi:hypothetical protein